MPFTISCECGKTFRVRSDQAGKRSKCSECGRVFVIPDRPPVAQSSRSCPSCHQIVAPDAVLCVHCGLDLKTGNTLQTAMDAKPQKKMQHRDSTSPVKDVPKFMLVGSFLGIFVFVVFVLMDRFLFNLGILGIVHAAPEGSLLFSIMAYAVVGAVFGSIVVGTAGFFQSRLSGYIAGATIMGAEKGIGLWWITQANTTWLTVGIVIGGVYGLLFSKVILSIIDD